MSAEEAIAPSSSRPLIVLRESLESCSKAIEAGDFKKSEDSISELSEHLDSISDAAYSYPNDDSVLNDAIAVPSHLHSFLSNPSLQQGVIDALSFELPKVIAKFSGVSQKCSQIVDSIIDLFTTKCSPRDMISVFSEALDAYGKATDAPGYVACILRGVSKVFLSIQRRPFEQIKVAAPIIVNSLKMASFDIMDDGDVGLKGLFEGAIDIANSIKSTCTKLEGMANEQLRALLGLYVLEIMTVISISMGNEVPSCLPLIQNLSCFFPYCGLSYADIIDGRGVDQLIRVLCGDDANDYMNCFPYVKHGAVLVVIWGHISSLTVAAEQDFGALKDELRNVQSKRWSAIGQLKYIFSLDNLPCALKKHATNFLLYITENVNQEEMNDDTICSFHTPSIMTTLQTMLSVIMNAPDVQLRKNVLVAVKKVVADNPPSLRLDIMQFLVRTCNSSTMEALLLDIVRENLRDDYRKLQEGKICSSSSYWDAGIVDLLELVLRPPDGGCPFLPEQSDAVLSALNLYRYVLITESTGKTNYTGVMSRSNLQKACSEWLLPLRTLVAAIMAENNDHDQLGFDIVCGLNPLELVLYRCIELAEEQLKQLP